MIRNLAEILNGFIEEEKKKLSQYRLKHGPTIGDMYEGLSTELINRSIPPQLNLKIVYGFITDGADYLSGQMDCMLVRGDGEEIPYTSSYKWHVKDVLVVFEVKKNLYSKDLINSIDKLKQVSIGYAKYLFENTEDSDDLIDLNPTYKRFSQLTGILAPNYHDRKTLTQENEILYTTLMMEQLTPTTIVLGYDGFSSEFNLREALINFISENSHGGTYGVPSYPDLIISNKHSLVKANGYPYFSPLREGYWDFLLSSKVNPIHLMLELIWSKLSIVFGISMPWGEDLELEALNIFLSAKPVVSGDEKGWHLKYAPLPDKILKSSETTYAWEPTEISYAQFVVFNLLGKSNISINDPEFVTLSRKDTESTDEFIKSLISSNLIVLDNDELSLISDNIIAVATSDNKYLVGDNESGRFERWLKKKFKI
ncbi:DUF6602 domain-containing protein [Desulfoluna spongiiphila]|uniref:DUF6602 domain-containing protein n=1 Tax=Desulfoluna spongiiphila TaxID=419481 RepID=UPI0012534CA1|nr:DUF6602 domain-containing protein [Desulfoluna spongiiphila]VVS94675.1 hypothetical protein DBB_42470 [Desulfoluna spongiiphila]